MQFCEDCGSMMKPEGDRMVCTDCGTTTEQESFVSTQPQEDPSVVESSEDINFEGQPTATDVTCEECGTEEAYYTLVQTASADEPPTRFYKCSDCGHRWRGYN